MSDGRSGTSIAALLGHRGLVLGAAFAPDGRAVVTGSTDGMIRTWAVASDPRTGRARRAHHEDPSRRGLCWGASSSWPRAGGTRRACWVLDGRRVVHVLAHGDGRDEWVESARLGADGRHVLTAGDDGTVKVWRADSGALVATLGTLGDQALLDAAFSADGRLIAAAGLDDEVRVWRWRTGKLIRRLGGFSRVDGVAFSPGGALLAAAGDGTLRVWRVADGAHVASVSTGEGKQYALTSVAFAPGGNLLAAGSSSGAVWLWDRRREKRLARLARNGDAVTDVSFDAATRCLVAVLAHRGTAEAWWEPTARSARDGAANAGFVPRRRRLRTERPPGHRGRSRGPRDRVRVRRVSALGLARLPRCEARDATAAPA